MPQKKKVLGEKARERDTATDDYRFRYRESELKGTVQASRRATTRYGKHRI